LGSRTKAPASSVRFFGRGESPFGQGLAPLPVVCEGRGAACFVDCFANVRKQRILGPAGS